MPVSRPPGTRPPCAWCPKIPKGDPPEPWSAQELSAKNAAAYLHYLECKSVGRFPDDAIVRRNAALIRHMEDDAAEIRAAVSQLRFMTRVVGA